MHTFRTSGFATAILVLTLSACGGGDDNAAITPPPVVGNPTPNPVPNPTPNPTPTPTPDPDPTPDPAPDPQPDPERPPMLTVEPVIAADDHTCAISSSGTVKCWGLNNGGQLGDNTTTNSFAPVDVQGLGGDVVAIAAGKDFSCAITGSSELRCWGNYPRTVGAPEGSPTPVVLLTDVATVVVDLGRICAVTNAGELKCWGTDIFAALNSTGLAIVDVPTAIAGFSSGVRSVGLGAEHACAVTAEGGVKCWGENERGQLGNGTTIDSPTPVDVQGLTSGVKAVSARFDHSCALLESGRVKCWGWNSSYELGAGIAMTYSAEPLDVVEPTGLPLTEVASISAGYFHTCALQHSGTVKCWGSNATGQLGSGNAFQLYSSTARTPIELDNSIVAIASGALHTCAYSDKATVKCWGENDWGQLGAVTPEESSVRPVDVAGF